MPKTIEGLTGWDVGESVKQCATCKHWMPHKEEFDGTPFGYGNCEGLREDALDAFFTGARNMENSYLFTGPEFFCKHWTESAT